MNFHPREEHFVVRIASRQIYEVVVGNMFCPDETAGVKLKLYNSRSVLWFLILRNTTV